MTRRKLAIIGNGMATGRLLDELLRRDGLSQFDVTVFGEEPHGCYNRILLNRVLLAGLRLGSRLAQDGSLRVTLYRLAASMQPGVSTARLDGAFLDQAERAVNRLTAVYRPALALIRMLLEAEGVTLNDGDAVVRAPGMLFDMNRVFQAVLSRFLSDHLVGYAVRDEYRLNGMMTYHPHHDPWRRRAPSPRPDFAVLDGGRVVALLDAKYIDLWTQRAIGRDALYQLAVYALSQPPGTPAVILYPTTAVEAREARVAISDPVRGGVRAHVIARPVVLDKLEPLLDEEGGVAAERARTGLARHLVFGDA